MLTANNSNNYRIIARDAKKGINYFCPACKLPLILKQGEVMIWHFAHKNLGECWWENESEEHLSFKLKIYDYYSSLGYSCALEKITADKKNIIDIEVIDKKNQKIAIEIQLSNITDEKVLERTKLLSNSGYYVLWLLGGNALNLNYDKKTNNFSNNTDRTTGIMFLMHNKFYSGRIYTITKNLLIRANPTAIRDPQMEIGSLYLKYRTKTVIDYRRYIPISNYENFLCIESEYFKNENNKGIKIARFYDKHFDLNKGFVEEIGM